MPGNFGSRLKAAFEKEGQLCVGIDPHRHLLEEWGLADSSEGLLEFSIRVLEAAAGRVGLIKPQVSFFERFGARGYDVLAEVTQLAKSAGLLVIADCKRGDIGTTMDAYLEAWFGEHSGLYADAITTSPYLGLEATTDQLAGWYKQGKGIFSLVATSNPEGRSVQKAVVGSQTLAGNQWSRLENLNAQSSTFGSLGAVLGATVDFDDFGIAKKSGKTPILAPGFGAQGAQLQDANRIFGDLASQVAYSVSRSILQFGPKGLEQAIDGANEALAHGLSR